MDEGRCAKEKGGARRWGPVRIRWEGDTKVGAGAHGRRAARMGEGWGVSVCVGACQCVSVRVGARRCVSVHVGACWVGWGREGGGRRAWEEPGRTDGGRGGWEARQGAGGHGWGMGTRGLGLGRM